MADKWKHGKKLEISCSSVNLALLIIAGITMAMPVRSAERPGDQQLMVSQSRPIKPDAPDHPAEPVGPDHSDAPEQPAATTPPRQQQWLSTAVKVRVKKFRFEGNTVFTDQVLSGITAPYEGREISAEELQQVRQEVTRFYVVGGYVNSGAVIPDQDIADGIIVLRIVEGRLAEIKVAVEGRLSADYVRKRIALVKAVQPDDPDDPDHPVAGPPLNIRNIQRRLLLLQQDPRIGRINAVLTPGTMPGEGILAVRVQQQRAYKMRLEVNNHRPPSIAEAQALVGFEHLNLIGYGDAFNLDLGITKGLDLVSVRYQIPLNADDTMLSLRYARGGSEIVADPLAQFDIEAGSDTIGVGIESYIRKHIGEVYKVGLRLERRRSETKWLGGAGVPLSDGVPENGKSSVSVLRFTQSLWRRDSSQVFVLRHTVSAGIDAFDATIHNNRKSDGRFVTWFGQVRWVKKLAWLHMRSVLRTSVQLANDSLLPLEQFAIGGAGSVRGYRENQLVRDKGLVVSWELRIPVYRYRTGVGSIQFVPFLDFGWAAYVYSVDYGSGNLPFNGPPPFKGPPKEISEKIYSAGLGLRWVFSKRSWFDVYWGYPLNDISSSGDTLQDMGVHARLRSEVF